MNGINLIPGGFRKLRLNHSEELDRQVAKLISAEDSVRVVLECRKAKNNHPRVLALVSPKGPDTQLQCALFIMKSRLFSSKLMIRNIIPILFDFSAEMAGENSFVIRYSKKNKTKQVVFLSTSSDEIGSFLFEASNAYQVALIYNFTMTSLAAGQSHEWLLDHYCDEEHALKNILWWINAVNAKPTGSGPSWPLPAGAGGGGGDSATGAVGEVYAVDSLTAIKAIGRMDSQRTRNAPPNAAAAARNPVLISFMTGTARTEWIQNELIQREDEFTELRPVSLRICSWNVGSRSVPHRAELRSWIFGDTGDACTQAQTNTDPRPAAEDGGGAETAPLSAEESGGAGMREGKEQERKRCGGRGGPLNLFEEPRSSVLGHHERTGTDLDLAATLAGSSDKKQGPMSGMPVHPEATSLSALSPGALGKAAGGREAEGREGRPMSPAQPGLQRGKSSENLKSCDSGSFPDVVAVGLQEVVRLTANALTVKEASPESRAWLEALSAAIGAPYNYSVLVSRQYVGIYVFVAARRELVDSSVIREAQCKAIGCGILGQFGNKGAVCVRLAVYNASVCFVCAHLAAGEEQTSRRNADMLEISKRLVFSNSKRGLISPEPSRAAAAPYQDAVKKGTLSRATSADAVSEADVGARGGTFPGLGKSLLADITRTTEMRAGQLPFWMDPGMEARGSVIEDHDLIFWFGDLNYRLDLSRERALALLQAGRLEDMFVCDQLYQQRMLGNVFVGYKETRPAFWPTYKYDLGSSEYDTSEKQRVPSWTDRVLWRCKRGACRQGSYERHELGGSDHRPISASFTLDVPRVLMDKLTLVAEQVSKHLDDIDNTCAPCAHVSRTHLHFAEARYRCAQAQTVTVSNAGKVFAHFQLVPQQDLENGAGAGQLLSSRCGAQGGGGGAGKTRRCHGARRGSDWLSAEPGFGLLMPGETRELVLTADIRDPVARKLRHGMTQLTRTLILQVQGGNAIFLTITADVAPTAFGRSLEALSACPFPVRSAPVTWPSDAERRQRAGVLLPKEIWRLVGELYQRLALGGRDERLFVSYGDLQQVKQIRECIDTGEPLDAHLQSRSIAEALLQLLRSLAVPIIPPKVHQACIEIYNDAAKLWTALQALPPAHMAVLVYLIAFLRELLLHKPLDLTPETLALVWGYVLMQPDLEVNELDTDDSQERATTWQAGGGIGATVGILAPQARGRDAMSMYLTREQAIVLQLLRGNPLPPAP